MKNNMVDLSPVDGKAWVQIEIKLKYFLVSQAG